MVVNIFFTVAAVAFAAVASPIPPAGESDWVLMRRTANGTAQVQEGSGAVPNNITTDSIVLHGFEGCSTLQKQMGRPDSFKSYMIDGFKEQNTMAGGQYVQHVWVYPEVDWNSAAAIDFFGPGYKHTDATRSGVQTNLDQEANLDYAWFFGWYLHVRCDDLAHQCPLPDCPAPGQPIPSLPPTEAYTMHGTASDGTDVDNQINFCPRYFLLPSLGTAIAHTPSTFLRDYYNRAVVWAHEVLHVDWLSTPVGPTTRTYMTDIRIRNAANYVWKAYSVIDTKYLGFSNRPLLWDSSNNPQNYAFYMLAQYVQSNQGFYPLQDVWITSRDPPPAPPGAVYEPPGQVFTDTFGNITVDGGIIMYDVANATDVTVASSICVNSVSTSATASTGFSTTISANSTVTIETAAPTSSSISFITRVTDTSVPSTVSSATATA